jgi:hypothetical protein
LRWWIAAPHHQSLRAQWHECLHAFVVISLVMATIVLLRTRRRGMPPKRGVGEGAS